MRLLASVLVVGLLSAAVAGCVTPSAVQPAAGPVEEVLGALKLLPEAGFQMDVPLDVVLLGFPPEVASALQAKLEPTPIDHRDGSFPRNFPPDPKDFPPKDWESWPAPTQPVAVFRVHDLDATVESAFYAAAAGWKVEDSKRKALDAEAAEAWLAEALPGAGIALDAQNPLFVILHGGDALGEHSWRTTFTHGYLEPVRIFGEREPLAVFDVSAMPDPYVVGKSALDPVFDRVYGSAEPKPYDGPIESSGDKTVETLALLSVDAAHYRFLKGPIYPISTRPCHHVTLVLGVQGTALGEYAPGMPRARDLVDVAALEGAFENLTRDDVSVELKVLKLPQDEPVLDALMRTAGHATLDQLRWYVDTNFNKFVTPQEGCEEYLSLLVIGDSATTGQFGGIGMYDVKRSHRISFSIVNDVDRIRDDYRGPGDQVIAPKSPSRIPNLVNLLYSHETGHLFGQHHPQHLADGEGGLGYNPSFEAVYSVMSYQQLDRNIDFGAVDHSTWARGRVGYTVRDAQMMGLEDAPAFKEAMERLERGDWVDAHLALEPLVQDAGHAHTGGAAWGYHVTGQHVHPWG